MGIEVGPDDVEPIHTIGDAKYEWMSEDEAYFATVEGLPGLWASAPTIEECRNELLENLEEWLLFRIRHQMPVPPKGGMDLNLRIDGVV
jgi:predicted RNase H-like HicB family nuclease